MLSYFAHPAFASFSVTIPGFPDGRLAHSYFCSLKMGVWVRECGSSFANNKQDS